MDSLYHWINRSQSVNAWNRFRMPFDEWTELLAVLRRASDNGSVRPHNFDVEGVIVADDSTSLICVGEPALHSPGLFKDNALSVSVGFTIDPQAVEEFKSEAEHWRIESGSAGSGSRSGEVIYALACAAERHNNLELERRVLRALRGTGNFELEGEQLFLSLSQLVHDLFSPVYLEIQPETASDFWPEREDGWIWRDPRSVARVASAVIVPRHRLAIYRRDRTAVIEDVANAAELANPAELLGSNLLYGLLLPLSTDESRLGFIKLFYHAPLQLLSTEIEAAEIFRHELSELLDTHRKHLRSQRFATIDGLTQLFNHRFFTDQLRTEFQRARRYKKPLALIMTDIDDFKAYNDTYGHLAGDRVLAEIAMTIRSSVRDIDFVARYGGEEFALILPEVTADGGLIVAEKIRKAVAGRKYVTEEGESIGALTVSCGVTDNADMQSAEEMIARADRALYWVKRHGRNLVRLAGTLSDVD